MNSSVKLLAVVFIGLLLASDNANAGFTEIIQTIADTLKNIEKILRLAESVSRKHLEISNDTTNSLNDGSTQIADQSEVPDIVFLNKEPTTENNLAAVPPAAQTKVAHNDLNEVNSNEENATNNRRSFQSHRRKSFRKLQDELRERRRNRKFMRKISDDQHVPSMRTLMKKKLQEMKAMDEDNSDIY